MSSITALSHAHMIAQVRARQLATKDSQTILQEKIVALWKENQESSGEKFSNNFQEKLYEMYMSSVQVNNYLEKYPTDQVGYPIKNNKTSLQLKMAYEWSQEKDDTLLEHIAENKLYHDLNNSVDAELPHLQSPSDTIFWGNENPSVSSILLASLGSVMGIQQKKMSGAGSGYDFNAITFSPDGRLFQDRFSTSPVPDIPRRRSPRSRSSSSGASRDGRRIRWRSPRWHSPHPSPR